MSIDRHQLSLLCSVPRGDLLCLGYPDLLVPEAALRELGASTFREVANPKIGEWHGWQGKIYETDPVLRDLGFRPVYLDIAVIRGPEQIHDLNEPLPDDLHGRFDTVFDGGTLEHILNIGQALKNCHMALKPDGYVLHVNPVSQINHGFYCVSPGFYRDVYRDVAKQYVVWHDNGQLRIAVPDNPYQRATLPLEASNVVLCRYPHSGWPTQRKYALCPTLEAR